MELMSVQPKIILDNLHVIKGDFAGGIIYKGGIKTL